MAHLESHFLNLLQSAHRKGDMIVFKCPTKDYEGLVLEINKIVKVSPPPKPTPAAKGILKIFLKAGKPKMTTRRMKLLELFSHFERNGDKVCLPVEKYEELVTLL